MRRTIIVLGALCILQSAFPAARPGTLLPHRLRIEVSSSNFPRFDRNLNTGGNNYDESQGAVARNSVHHSTQYPSSIAVTVVKGAAATLARRQP